MNATVARIVEIMFQDTEMSEEVQALKDEVMNNCQERYNDMVVRGLSEDEAIAAVVDSLKGMEEVISQYPRKKTAEDDFDENELDDDDEDEDEDTEVDHTFDPSDIRLIRVNLVSDDVTVESSFDDRIHVCYDREDLRNLEVRREGDVLVVERSEGCGNRKIEMHINSREMKWNSFSDMFKDIGRMIAGSGIGHTIGRVTISLPKGHVLSFEGHTTSGDMELIDVALTDATLESMSGDLMLDARGAEQVQRIRVIDANHGSRINIRMENDDENQQVEGFSMNRVKLKSSSGDIEVNARCNELSVETMSGDVDITSSSERARISTVSGDLNARGSWREVQVKTISGDAELTVWDDRLESVTSQTTSGDLTIRLPESLRGQARVDMHTVSGDCRNRFGTPEGPAKVIVQAKSVSGDVTVK